MTVRLSTLDHKLAERILCSKSVKFKEASLAACKKAASASRDEGIANDILSAFELGKQITPSELSTLLKMSAELDEIYYELSENEDGASAIKAFSKARFFTAVSRLVSINNAIDAAECIYEAALSLEEPDGVVAVANEVFSS